MTVYSKCILEAWAARFAVKLGALLSPAHRGLVHILHPDGKVEQFGGVAVMRLTASRKR